MSIDNIEFKLNSKSVGAKIEELVAPGDLNYIEATIEAAEMFNVEPEHMQKYIPKVIKEKIAIIAKELNMLKKDNTDTKPLPLND